MNPFVELLEKLVSREIEEIKIEKEDMMGFLEAWRERPERKQIIGEAAHEGKITYRYKK